jgi:type IV pilus modification protein PilV
MLTVRFSTKNTASQRARPGFTLVELLVALMVFSIGALAMVATSANVMTMISASKNRAIAAAVAEARLERMRGQPCTAHRTDSTTTNGVKEVWTTVALARADDVTVKVTFVSNHKNQTRIYRSFLPCSTT